MPPVNWRRHLAGHSMPGRSDTKGRTRYHEPNMAHSPASATPSDTTTWEREAWVDRMASLSDLREHIPGDVRTPDNQQPAPSGYMTLMDNIHYTLSKTHYHAPTGHWLVHGTNSLFPVNDAPPPPHNSGPDTYCREDEPNKAPHLGHAGAQVPGHADRHPQPQRGP